MICNMTGNIYLMWHIMWLYSHTFSLPKRNKIKEKGKLNQEKYIKENQNQNKI